MVEEKKGKHATSGTMKQHRWYCALLLVARSCSHGGAGGGGSASVSRGLPAER